MCRKDELSLYWAARLSWVARAPPPARGNELAPRLPPPRRVVAASHLREEGAVRKVREGALCRGEGGEGEKKAAEYFAEDTAHPPVTLIRATLDTAERAGWEVGRRRQNSAKLDQD